MTTALVKRAGAIIVGTVVGLAAMALPASALGLGIGGSSVLHIQDCRSAALTRQAAYNMEFSSQTTGSVPVHVAAMADGSITLCYSLDVKTLSDVTVVTDTYVTAQGIVSGLVSQSDASWACTAIRLTVGPGVQGSVTATSHAHVAADSAPPADWDNVFGKDVAVSNLGEDIVLRACADTSGDVSAS